MKITRPSDAPSNPSGARPRAYDLAQERAIEKKRTPYIPLICGHFTTWEDDERYSAWRPKGPISHYCEHCGKWVSPLLHKKKKTVLPSEPMF